MNNNDSKQRILKKTIFCQNYNNKQNELCSDESVTKIMI